MKKNLFSLLFLILVFNLLNAQNPGVVNSTTSNYFDVLRYTGNGSYCPEGILLKTRIPSGEDNTTTLFIKGFIIEGGEQKIVDLKIHWSGSYNKGLNFAQASNTGNIKPVIFYGSFNDGNGDFMYVSLQSVQLVDFNEGNLKITALCEAQNLDINWFNEWSVECFNSMYGNWIPYSQNEFGGIKADDIIVNNGLLATTLTATHLISAPAGDINDFTASIQINTPLLNATTGSFANSLSVGTTSTNPNYKLIVDGTISTKKLRVNTTPWADFVFYKNYKLMPLTKLEQYIKTYKHLPDIPTTEDVQKDGVDIGEIQAKLLQKVEELTLYVIEQDKKIKQLETQIKSKKRK
jgi:hypothetical protein